MAESYRQPSEESRKELNDIVENKPDTVQIVGTNKKYEIKWLHKKTIRKITDIIHSGNDKDDDMTSCKVAACIILNNLWKMKFLYWLLWRWFFYVKEYDDYQLQPIIEMGKKKVPQEAYYVNTILVTGMMDTIQTMTRKEVERFRQELSGAQPTQ